MELTTLCYLEQEDSYLFLHRTKKEGDINKDKWIGVGGHFEFGESPEDCLLREVKEETGFTLTEYQFRGIITFLCDQMEAQYMHLYTATKWTGTQQECEEGQLRWVKKESIFDLNLWEGDKIFLHLLEMNYPFFSLKLVYEEGILKQAVLDGKKLKCNGLNSWSGSVHSL